MNNSGKPADLVAHWEADWLRAVLDRSQRDPWIEDAGIHAVVDGCEVRVLGTDPRLGVSVLPIAPTLMLRSSPTTPFFDAREWMELFDRSTHEDLTGADQLVVLDHLDEVQRSQDACDELRSVRRRWTTKQGNRALDSTNPEWPQIAEAPTWLVELDRGLTESGFDSGWTVLDGDVEPIGIVRQRGPLRVQLTMLDSQPLVQLAVWPLVPWIPISVVADSLKREDPDEVDAVIEIGEELCDGFFVGQRVVEWNSKHRRESSLPSLEGQKGPRPNEAYFRPNIPTPDRSFNTEDLGSVIDGMRLLASSRGGTHNKVRPAGRKPASMSYNGSSYYISEPVRELIDTLVPDIDYFEMSVDGDPYFVPTLNQCSGGDKTDYARSRMNPPLGRPADGGLVLDPRQLMRSTDAGSLVNNKGSWLFDAKAATRFAELGIESTPVWRD